jgi:primosomal protein N' (replication factor Y)
LAYAEVAVAAPASPGKAFSYSIPEGMTVQVGHAVQVPFGSRQLPGFAFEIVEVPSYPETRDISRVIDAAPWLTPTQVALARWTSETYRSSLYSAASLMITPGFRQKILAEYEAPPATGQTAEENLDERQREVLEYLRSGGKANEQELAQHFGKRNATIVLGQLVRRRLAYRSWAWQRPSVRPKYSARVRLAGSRTEALAEAQRLMESRATKQGKLLAAIAEEVNGYTERAELTSRFGVTSPALTALEKRGLILTEQVRVDRDPLAGKAFQLTYAPDLAADQQTAWEEISGALDGQDRPEAFLLFGVTGSGKTELYLRALEKVVAAGKRGIVLVPEIALTPQTIQRFSGRFPGRVAVLHSHLSPGEQFDEWWRIREGQFDVVVGSRGAVFAPQPDLGLIVLDEEHEWTYKQQEQQPHFHARDVAVKRAELCGATVILGSATPAIESFHKAMSGVYRLLELPERIVESREGGAASMGSLPRVQLVDMRDELKSGNRTIFSRALHEGITNALKAEEQVILFLNRRGSSTFVQCRSCGYVARCRRCDSSLTYHSDRPQLRCHQCNYRTEPPVHCPECWSQSIRYMGLGTERLEREVAATWPAATTLRWDRDVTRGKDAHESILRQFVDHEANILIGTQMLAKGLHLPRVTLVGVINADIGLYVPDFRSPERVFQILCQVAGRSGRGAAGGQVVIQTYKPEHYAIAAAAAQDYRQFYDQEVALRLEVGLPPFTRILRLIYHHSNAGSAAAEAERVGKALRQRLREWAFPDTRLVGPAPAPYQRIRGRYRWHVVIMGPEPLQLIEGLYLPERWTVDVDPAQLL